MSYFCSKCKKQREQGCFMRGCPGIMTPVVGNALADEVERLKAERDELQRRIDEADKQKPLCRIDHDIDGLHIPLELDRLLPLGTHALYLKPFPAPAHTTLLAESSALFRRYESHHRAKGGEADDKAARNRDIAERIEAVLNDGGK